jgi:surfactin synthase thioesterase subunit
MKYLLASLILLTACGGSLSDEQRRQMREKMEENKIIKITDVEITEAAFARGRELVETLDSLRADSAKLEAFIKSQKGKISFITPDASNARLLERQLIDAYLSDTSGSFQDNVQKLRTADGDFDSLLYTKPVTKTLREGSEELQGVWNIWLPKKDLVLAIGTKK